MAEINADIKPIVKQLIIVNMAVPMGFGQIAAQVAHASMLGILNQGEWSDSNTGTIHGNSEDQHFSIECEDNPELLTWLRDHFTLVVLKTWGKDQILKLQQEAIDLGLNTAVMEDYGHTTALAIGPASEDKLKPFKRLTLL
jgi:peptidyl-tRNA hydrolase